MKKGDLLVGTTLLLLFAAGLLIQFAASGEDLIAQIVLNGEEIEQINLRTIAEPYEFKIESGDAQYDVVRVEQGRIRIIEANCPRQIAVKQGWISKPGQAIICLPYRLVITILGEELDPEDNLDAIVG